MVGSKELPISVAAIVSAVTATNDYSKEKQFRELNAVKDDIDVKVIRGGKQIQPARRNFWSATSCFSKVATRFPATACTSRETTARATRQASTGEARGFEEESKKDPFLLSGCQVTAGFCKMVLIAVGDESRWGASRLA